MRPILSAAVLAALLSILAACGNEYNSDTSTHNDADVSFAQEMIPHHEQAVMMSEVAETRAVTPEVKALAADIKAAQEPEIATMTRWLESWDEDVPDGHMSGMDHGDMSSELDDLEGTAGAGFDRMFLVMMIEHHEGAIEMARTEQSEGEYPAAIALAEKIERTQATEIQTMEGLLSP